MFIGSRTYVHGQTNLCSSNGDGGVDDDGSKCVGTDEYYIIK